MLRLLIAFCFACTLTASALAQSMNPARSIELAGNWRFLPDRTDSGVKQQLFNLTLPFPIKLPGVMQPQYGDEIRTTTPWVLSLYDRYWYLRDEYKDYTDKNVKIPFLSQPKRHYLGVAWYQREIDIPTAWATRRVVLTLERPHWETTVWIDSKRIGSDKSLVAPHIYDLGTVSPGRHRLTIRIDNRMIMPYRPDAHSVSDSLGASWNGIVGKIELTSTGRVWIDDAQVFPDYAKRWLTIKVRIGNQTGTSGSGTLTAVSTPAQVPVTWNEQGANATLEVPLADNVPTWDEFKPRLQSIRVTLKGSGGVDEAVDLKYGVRDFRAEGNEFRLNGHPVNFRGTHSGGDFPDSGYPAMYVDYWLKLFQTCRRWGLNHMRFHSWCPPEAAFEAADQIGFYLQPEPGMWNEISPDTPMEQMLYEETDRMIKAYGNHPSFMLLSASNEPKGKWKEALAKWVDRYHREDPRRLYANGTGHTEREIADITEGTDFLAIQRVGPKMLRRESAWFGSDYGPSLVDVNIPVIAHEVGQWVAYPNYEIIKRFNKSYLQPGNYEIFRDSAKAHGLLEKAPSFANASGKFQLACYKEEIEANLRTPGLGGFQLLDLHDYLGQGTALVGLLDAFWESKGYATEDDFKQFCNTTVPLARLRQRIFTSTDRFEVDVEVAHFGAEPLENVRAVWRIVGPKHEPQGDLFSGNIQLGKNIPLGKISANLATLGSPGQYKLIVTIAPASFFNSLDRTIAPGANAQRGINYFENEWNFWVYPPVGTNLEALLEERINPNRCKPNMPRELFVTSSWDEAEAKLASGGRVLFSPRNADLDWASPPLDAVPVFWNRQMGPAWGRMLGLFVDFNRSSRDDMLNGFPTNNYFDWQWAQLMSGTRAINLDRLPADLEPFVWAIDDWNRNYKLGVLFECVVGRGSLLVSAIDINKPSESNPVLLQLRAALMKYGSEDCFQPNVSVSPGAIRSLLFDTRIMRKLGARAQVAGEAADQVIDGDPNTFLLVGDQRAPAREQVDIVVTFKAPVPMSGLLLMPRQNHREHEGDIRAFVVQVSDDGNVWSEIARGDLISTFAPQRIGFTRPITTRYLKLISLSGFGTDKTTSLAELAVIYTGPKLNDKGEPIEYQRSRSATPEIDEGPERPKPSPSPIRPRP